MVYRVGLFLIMMTRDPLILCSNDVYRPLGRVENRKGCVFLECPVSLNVLFTFEFCGI